MSKPTLRSSSMPMVMTCVPSITNPDGILRVETDNETALLGTLVHAQAESVVKTGAFDLESIKQRVSEEDFIRANVLFNNFLSVWREAAKHMTAPITEWGFSVETIGAIITGHIDLHHIEAKRAFILDYKTGRQHEDHYHQMAAYAFGVWDKAGRPDNYTVYVTSVYLEDNSITPYTFTADRLKDWDREVAAQLAAPRYTAGRKCAFCTLQGACPAYRQYTAGALAVLTEESTIPGKVWEDMEPQARGDLVDKMYVIEKAIDRVKLSLRNQVKARGRMPIGPKMEYVLREEESKSLDSNRARKVLETRIGKGRVDQLAVLKLDDVLTAYASKAAKGQKTAARRELFEELDKAGAITRVQSTKMWRRPIDEALMEGS